MVRRITIPNKDQQKYSLVTRGTLQGTTKSLRNPTFWRRNIIFPSTLAGDVNFSRSTRSILYPGLKPCLQLPETPHVFSKTMGLKVQDSLRLLDTGMTAIIPVAASAAMVGCEGARWTNAIEILNKVPWVLKFEPNKPTEKLHILSLFEINSLLPRSKSPTPSSSVVP